MVTQMATALVDPLDEERGVEIDISADEHAHATRASGTQSIATLRMTTVAMRRTYGCISARGPSW